METILLVACTILVVGFFWEFFVIAGLILFGFVSIPVKEVFRPLLTVVLNNPEESTLDDYALLYTGTFLLFGSISLYSNEITIMHSIVGVLIGAGIGFISIQFIKTTYKHFTKET